MLRGSAWKGSQDMIREFQTEKEKHKYFNTLSEMQKIEAFREIITLSKCAVFLGGAGVSTESGIPDFRSKNGLYRKGDRKFRRYRPEYLLSYECLYREPKLFFEYYRENLDARRVEPNAAHYALAQMEKEGWLEGVITQNIDGLHQKAGSVNVQEIHGTTLVNHCISCRREYDADFVFDSQDPVPKCPVCGKMVRPDVTLYGETLPSPAYDNAWNMVNKADCLIIGGTSLEVGSAAQLAHIFHGKYLIIINKGKTRLTGKVDLVFRDSIGKILSEIVK